MSGLRVRPLTLKQANACVSELHRHHQPVRGHRFSIGCFDDAGNCHGAAIVGRPVARAVDQYSVAEVTRLVTDGTANACSLLYGACARAAKAMGFDLIQTYILDSETGISLKASGWHLDGTVKGRSWSCPSRPRKDSHPTIAKQRWIRVLMAEQPVAA